MAARKKTRRGGSPPRKRPEVGAAAADATVVGLLRRTLSTYVRALPRIAVVALAGTIPLQLALAWIYERQGLADDAFWQMQYQGFGDWIFGSLIVAALYVTINGTITGEAPKGLLRTLIWAYRRGLGAWIGMFLTRMMVSFVIGVVSLPVLGGLWLIGRFWPRLRELLAAPDQLAAASPGDFAPLLLLLPLFLPAIYMYLRYCLTEVVVSLEPIDGFGALQRSKALTQGAKGKIILGLLPLAIPLTVVELIALSAASALGPYIGAILIACEMVLGALGGVFLLHIYLSQGGPKTAAAPNTNADADADADADEKR